MMGLMRIVVFGLSVILMAAPALAQQARKVVVRSLCFEHVDGLKSVHFLKKDAGELEIPLWLGEPSDDIILELPSSQLSFHVPASGNEEQPQLAAQGKLGSGQRHLLFFVPSGKETPKYWALSFPDDERSFPMGAVRLLNLAKVPAVFQLGERITKVPVGGSAIVPMPRKVNRYNDYNFEIKLEMLGGLYPVRQTRGRAVKTKRDMAVVYIDPRSQRAKVNLYTDIPPWTLPKMEPEE